MKIKKLVEKGSRMFKGLHELSVIFGISSVT